MFAWLVDVHTSDKVHSAVPFSPMMTPTRPPDVPPVTIPALTM